jgi:hypothetical protein
MKITDIDTTNRFLISEEAYFGLDNPFVNSVKAHITEMRSVMERAGDFRKPSFISEMERISESFGKCVASNVNAESCSISFFRETNAFCIPMCWDSYASLKKQGVDVKKHIVSLEDIVETSKGYKFKSPERKKLILCIGLGLFDIMSDDEVTSIVFHEIGHAFQHMLVGVNGNITWVRLHNTIINNAMLLDIFILLSSMGISLFGIDSLTESRAKKDRLNNTGVDHLNRDKTVDELKDMQEKEMKDAYDDLKDGKKKGFNIFFAFWGAFIGLFVGFIKLTISILYPLFSALNFTKGLYELANIKWLKKNRMFEQFADHFASVYGLGPHLASALKKFGGSHIGPELDSLNFLNYVPLLNVWLAWSHHLADSSSTLQSGYPDTRGRHAVIYKTLAYELQNNKDLTDKEKKEIQEQMDGVEKIYQEYINTPGSKGVVFRMVHRVVEKSVADVKSDVEENVLEVLAERQKDIEAVSKSKEISQHIHAFQADPVAAIAAIRKKQAF